LPAVFEADPVTATLLGLPGHDDRLPDYTEDAGELLGGRVRGIAARAEALDPATLSRDDRVTRAVVLHQAQAALDHLAARAVEYTVTDLWPGTVTDLLALLSEVGITGRPQADGYLARLAGLPDVLAAIAERHRTGIAAGRLPVRHQVEAMVAYLDRYLADADDDLLRRPAAAEDSGVDVRAFRIERDRLLHEVVRPALAGYRTILVEEVAVRGRPAERGGLCWLPDGERLYAGLVRTHTTVDLSPQQLHQIGRDACAALVEEYVDIGAAVLGTGDLEQILTRLRTDPQLRWRDGQEVIDAARAAIDRAEQVAPRWFGRLPGHRCQVEAIPANTNPAAPPSYTAPATDGTRPGTYLVNTYRPQERQRYLNDVNAFHEAMPGHHLQMALAQTLPEVPLLRRLLLVTAYVEGWALYAERLADEMGLYSGPLARLGMLTLDSLRAARLVVDTGLHALGWSKQQAVAYLTANVAMSSVEIDTQVDQYIAAPGQALGYLVGRLEIQRLRTHAEHALGERFDVRTFHDVVLGSGQLPLPVLAELVLTWIGDHRTNVQS